MSNFSWVKVREEEEGITMRLWGDFFLVYEHASSGEGALEFVMRVLYGQHSASMSNHTLALMGDGAEGCFHSDREAADAWFDHCVAVNKENP